MTTTTSVTTAQRLPLVGGWPLRPEGSGTTRPAETSLRSRSNTTLHPDRSQFLGSCWLPMENHTDNIGEENGRTGGGGGTTTVDQGTQSRRSWWGSLAWHRWGWWARSASGSLLRWESCSQNSGGLGARRLVRGGRSHGLGDGHRRCPTSTPGSSALPRMWRYWGPTTHQWFQRWWLTWGSLSKSARILRAWPGSGRT